MCNAGFKLGILRLLLKSTFALYPSGAAAQFFTFTHLNMSLVELNNTISIPMRGQIKGSDRSLNQLSTLWLG